jgi:hypothetical protein
MVRTVVVILLAATVIGLTLPNVFVSGSLGSNLPISVNEHYEIISITPGSIADAAHLRVGDHIEPQSLTVEGRLALINAWYLLRSGEILRFTVDRAGQRFAAEIRQPVVRNSYSGLTIVKRLTATIFVLVATVLLLLRPSPMMWGFFLYALGATGGGPLILEFVNPLAHATATILLVAVVYTVLGPLGLLLFATRFPASASGGWRHVIERTTPVLALLLLIPSAAIVLVAMGVELPRAGDLVTNAISTSIVTIGIIALVAGFMRLDPSQKQRLRWVMAGFGVFYTTAVYEQMTPYLPAQGWPPAWSNAGWTSDVLNGFVIFIPVTVAYAVLKHHVLDINFVIGRGLVYGLLTSIAVATFAIVDWFLGTVLAQTKLAVAGEVVAAVAIGFWLNGLHGKVDRFVDAVIFRRRHAAEQRLARVAAGLPHVQSSESLAALLVSEPVSALGLLSGSYFERSDNGEYRCAYSVGLSRPISSIAAGDALLVHLYGARGPVFLHHIEWHLSGTEGEPATPIVAFPVFVRYELQAIILYGGHATGEAIDPDELRTLLALCVGAGAALDHLEAQDLRRRLDDSQRALAAATANVATTG